MKQLFLDGLTEQVNDHRVNFLNARCFLMGNGEANVDLIRQSSSVPPGKAYGFHLLLPTGGDSFQDVRGGSASADGERHVTHRAQGFHLTAEHHPKIAIVGYASQNGSVGSQSDGGKGRAIETEPIDQF